MSIEEIGCCGAYCRTCRVYQESLCQGCKLGYASSERDIAKAKCAIKVCCLKRAFQSCADCTQYDSCAIIQRFYRKNGAKYRKYREATQYIRTNGYDQFIAIADGWKMQHGRYPQKG